MRPLLLLFVSRDAQLDPAGLDSLKRQVWQELGARLVVKNLEFGVGSRLKLLGHWDLTPCEVWALLAELMIEALVDDVQSPEY